MHSVSVCNASNCPKKGIQDSEGIARLKDILPEGFDYVVCKCITVAKGGIQALFNMNMFTKDQALQWLSDYQEKTKTTLRVNRTNPSLGSRVVYRVSYRCQHNTKAPVAKQRKSSKNTSCPAELEITVCKNRVRCGANSDYLRKSRSSDPHRITMPTHVSLNFTHNHSIDAADALKHRDVSEEAKQKLTEILLDGYKPSVALELFKFDLQLNDPDNYEINSADRKLCPDQSYVYRLYNLLFRKQCKHKNTDKDSSKSGEDSSNTGEECIVHLQRFIEDINSKLKGELFFSTKSTPTATGKITGEIAERTKPSTGETLTTAGSKTSSSSGKSPTVTSKSTGEIAERTKSSTGETQTRTSSSTRETSTKTSTSEGEGDNCMALPDIFNATTLPGAVQDIVRMEVTEDNKLVVAICTPFMRRVHHLIRHSREVMFCYASGNLERNKCRVVLLLTCSCVGGLPLGALIMTNESPKTQEAAWHLFYSMLDNDSFYSRGRIGPELIMTDDNVAEKLALSVVFPHAKRLLCVSHILQSFWRYLWDCKSAVLKDEQPVIFALFKQMVYANTKEEFDEIYSNIHSSPVCSKYPKVLAYIDKLDIRNEEWAICHHKDLAVSDESASKFCETAMRVMKDQVLHKTKTFTVHQHIDFITTRMERYYNRKCLDVASNRFARVLQSWSFAHDVSKEENIIRLSDNEFEVRNEGDEMKSCNVDMSLGICTCQAGFSGRPCKHQAGVLQKYHSWDFSPQVDSKMQYLLFVLATGKCLTEMEWFALLHEQPLDLSLIERQPATTCLSSITVTINDAVTSGLGRSARGEISDADAHVKKAGLDCDVNINNEKENVLSDPEFTIVKNESDFEDSVPAVLDQSFSSENSDDDDHDELSEETSHKFDMDIKRIKECPKAHSKLLSLPSSCIIKEEPEVENLTAGVNLSSKGRISDNTVLAAKAPELDMNVSRIKEPLIPGSKLLLLPSVLKKEPDFQDSCVNHDFSDEISDSANDALIEESSLESELDSGVSRLCSDKHFEAQPTIQQIIRVRASGYCNFIDHPSQTTSFKYRTKRKGLPLSVSGKTSKEKRTS